LILTDQTFNQEVESNDIILVDFWAEWCGPCKMISPILDEISNEYGLPVGKLNVDENPGKAQEYSVQSIPTMVLFRNGKPVHTVLGAMPKHKLLKELAEWLS
jgi:thioredoxin 1